MAVISKRPGPLEVAGDSEFRGLDFFGSLDLESKVIRFLSPFPGGLGEGPR